MQIARLQLPGVMHFAHFSWVNSQGTSSGRPRIPAGLSGGSELGRGVNAREAWRTDASLCWWRVLSKEKP